jgi:hypothetical protein
LFRRQSFDAIAVGLGFFDPLPAYRGQVPLDHPVLFAVDATGDAA